MNSGIVAGKLLSKSLKTLGTYRNLLDVFVQKLFSLLLLSGI